ncbi:heparinase II/III family protein [Egicoccus sp. AB-alg6-2]|uniref:heparinase II/III domain-containing protein n=1 Tax=Egicoccus sp. AB-alg6-2 TaxID=3242692 RepID=UPI00359E5997
MFRTFAAVAAAAVLVPLTMTAQPALAQDEDSTPIDGSVRTEAPPAPTGDEPPSGLDHDPLADHPAEPYIGTASVDAQRGSLCLGYSGIDRDNPVEQVMRGEVVLTSRPAVQVMRDGRVDWSLNPYGDSTWRLWFQSLRWTGSLIRSPDAAAVQRATDIARDWTRTHDVQRLQGQDAEAVRHRSNVLLCLRERIGAHDWLDAALARHADFLLANYSGDWNHGLDDNLALYGVGCVLDRADLRRAALERNDNLARVALHPGGGSNEQAVGYDLYVNRRFRLLMQMAEQCGDTVDATTRRLVEAMPNFIAHATKPNGYLPNIGDSYAYDRPDPIGGTPMEYVRSAGTQGTPPADRAAIFDAGYVFGRSGWGQGERAFAEDSWWSGRFGPARDVHGHEDRTSILWHARGRDLLVDSGHVGYETSAYRQFLRSPQGHNVLTVSGETWRSAPTRLTRSELRAGADFVEFDDRSYPNAPRQRSVLVASDPEVVVVFDRASAPASRVFTQHWHLPPDMAATPVGRSYVDARTTDGTTKLILQQVALPGQEVPAGSTRVVRGSTDPLQGWRSFQVRERTPAPTVEMRRTGTSTAHLTVLAATEPAANVSSEIARTADGWLLLQVRVGGETLHVRISPGGYLGRTQGPATPAARGTFADDDGSVHEANIELLVAHGITQGCDRSGTRFCPDHDVTRGQLASFLARALELPPATRDHFDDDTGSVHEDAINRAADAGYVQGFGARTYRPDEPVSRAASASMLDRALGLPAATRDHFRDDAGSVHEDAINRLAEAQITRGCSSDGRDFCPTESLSRGQMASLLARALELE